MYFFYLEWYWGFRLAKFIIRYEIRGEKKYGIRTTGHDNLWGAISAEDRTHVSIYEPLNYYTSSRLLNYLQPADFSTAFLDAGCGKGRLLAMAASYGFTEIYGIDICKKLCDSAVQICQGIQKKSSGTSIVIERGDARDYQIPDSVGVIFLFNPFDEVVMRDFIQRVFESLARRNRPLKLLYANPQCKQQWLDAGFEETESFTRLKYLQGSVLVRK